MKQAIARMVWLGLISAALYAFMLVLIDRSPTVDIKQPVAVGWTGAWGLGVVFSAWNLWDAILDARAAYLRNRSERIRAGSLWRLRSDLLQFAACVMMALAGVLAILLWSTIDLRTGLIMAGGFSIVVNQVWNRLDRERVIRMPRPIGDAEYLERIAMDLARDARMLGHDVGNGVQAPVATLELLRVRPGMTAVEVAEIDEAITALVDLAAHVHRLHARIKAHDPSLRRGDASSTEAVR